MAELVHPVERSQSPERSWIARLVGRQRGWYLIGYLVLVVLALWTLFPVYWQLATSLRSDVDLFSPTVTLLPRVLTIDHYEKILGPSYPSFGNSATVRWSPWRRPSSPRYSARWRVTPSLAFALPDARCSPVS